MRVSMEEGPKTLTSASPSPMAHHLALLSSFLLHPKSPAATSSSPLAAVIGLLRCLLLLSLRLILLVLPRGGPRKHPNRSLADLVASSPSSSPAERALSHVLAAVSRVPVASRKYHLVRSLADRLLDDNLLFSSPSLNAAALSSAFSRTVRALEAAVPPPPAPAGSWPVEAVFSAVRRLGEAGCAAGEACALGCGDGSVEAEKMAAEAAWLAMKMGECGAVEDAVRILGEAAALGEVALTAEPRVQVALVRLSVFLFRHANSKQFGSKAEAEAGEDAESAVSHCRMALLTSWLPLLCRASNGLATPILSSGERADMVKVLEEMIEKLGREEQEVVLALWLHHFTSCPDSDWPNLEACYTRWYSKSRDLLISH